MQQSPLKIQTLISRQITAPYHKHEFCFFLVVWQFKQCRVKKIEINYAVIAGTRLFVSFEHYYAHQLYNQAKITA